LGYAVNDDDHAPFTLMDKCTTACNPTCLL
jgi:hypothetical protein